MSGALFAAYIFVATVIGFFVVMAYGCTYSALGHSDPQTNRATFKVFLPLVALPLYIATVTWLVLVFVGVL